MHQRACTESLPAGSTPESIRLSCVDRRIMQLGPRSKGPYVGTRSPRGTTGGKFSSSSENRKLCQPDNGQSTFVLFFDGTLMLVLLQSSLLRSACILRLYSRYHGTGCVSTLCASNIALSSYEVVMMLDLHGESLRHCFQNVGDQELVLKIERQSPYTKSHCQMGIKVGFHRRYLI